MPPKRNVPTQEGSAPITYPIARVGAGSASEVLFTASVPKRMIDDTQVGSGLRRSTRTRSKPANVTDSGEAAEPASVGEKGRKRAKTEATKAKERKAAKGKKAGDRIEQENAGVTAVWLLELHQKLWGRIDLFGDIFRSATLTTVDFVQLQADLKQANPSRASLTDVLFIKSNLLRSRSHPLAPEDIVSRMASVDVEEDFDNSAPLVADYPTISEDIREDATKLSEGPDAIFPCQILFMDLTVLKMDSINPRVPMMMLIRDEWHSVMRVEHEKGLAGSTVITGQPGIGKTCFLYYCLIMRLIQAKPTVFQDMKSSLFRLTDRVTHMLGRVDVEGEDILALIDADGAACTPNDNLFLTTNLRILLTSSPRNRADRNWLTQWCPYTGKILVMEGWSRDEFVVTALFMLKYDINFGALQNAVTVCGLIPRRCFAAAISPGGLRQAKSEVAAAILGSSANMEAAISNVHGDKPVPNRAFEIYPDPDDRNYALCMVRPVSQWVFDQIVEQLERVDSQAAFKFYKQIQGVNDAASFRGKLWERQVHKFFSTIVVPVHFQMYSLTDRSVSFDIEFSSNTSFQTFGPGQIFEGQLASSVEEKKASYFQPLSGTFATFDFFLYQHGVLRPGFQPLMGGQISDGSKHPLSLKGLRQLQKSLKPQVSQLNDLRPSTTKKLIVLFVVPAPMAASFSKQPFKEKAEDFNWDTKTAQFVLELDPNLVWKS